MTLAMSSASEAAAIVHLNQLSKVLCCAHCASCTIRYLVKGSLVQTLLIVCSVATLSVSFPAAACVMQVMTCTASMTTMHKCCQTAALQHEILFTALDIVSSRLFTADNLSDQHACGR